MTVSQAHVSPRRPRRHPWAVWKDPAGRVSWLRIVALILMFVPVGFAIYDALTVGFGPRPLNDVIHRTGYWALMLLIVSLAITLLRRIGRFGKLLDIRRMVGIGAFVYVVAHVLLYVADQKYDLIKVATEIALRVYLTLGFIAVVGLAILAATSTDAMVRRLGGMRWQRLHSIVYFLVLLAIIHYFQQNKADVWAPTLVAGVFTWLMGYRIIIKRKTTRGELPTLALVALTVVVAALTFLVEAFGIAIAFNTSPWMVLPAVLELDWYTIRPGWFVLALGGAVVVLDLVRARWNGQPKRTVQPAKTTTSAQPG